MNCLVEILLKTSKINHSLRILLTMSKYDYKFQVEDIKNFEVKYYIAENPKIIEKKFFPPHVDDSLEFYILFDGDASFSVENKVYKLSSMDIVVSKPNQIHNCILNSNSTHRHACFWFKSDDNDFIYKKFLNMKTQIITPSYEDSINLQEIVRKLKSLSKGGDKLTKLTLFLSMLNIFSNNVTENPIEQSIPTILKDILNDLNDNFININSLDYFTKKYNISSSTLNRLFKEHLSTSPKLFLETKRLAHSRKLLREGNSVMDACMKSGFLDYSNYIRLFKKRFNVTPNQYKKEK